MLLAYGLSAIFSLSFTYLLSRPVVKDALTNFANAVTDSFFNITNAVSTAVASWAGAFNEEKDDAESRTKVVPAEPKISYYWEAERVKVGGSYHVITGSPLTFDQARIRVSMGQNLMCANEAAARAIVFANGYVNAVGPEIHPRGTDTSGYFYHFHPNRSSHVHIWFYS